MQQFHGNIKCLGAGLAPSGVLAISWSLSRLQNIVLPQTACFVLLEIYTTTTVLYDKYHNAYHIPEHEQPMLAPKYQAYAEL